jgi:predicted unusual protein kinase regulating ubiquinone biosynthesis (AarF/ABC1/UbiB family)
LARAAKEAKLCRVSRLWLTISRSLIVAFTLLPTWLAYVVPFVRQRRFGATIPAAHWVRLHEKHSVRFYRLAVRMRGGLIKVGQILSTRADILPKEWVSTLSGLQDRVDPLPWPAVRPILEAAYGRDPKALFAEIDEHATNAASFGQVHRATTADGRRVALKIKYPDVERKLAIDFGVLGFFLPLFSVFLPQLNLRPIYEEIRRALATELDYEQEASFTELVHRNLAHIEHLTIPEVLREYTRRDVICTTWFEGKKITDPVLLNDPRMDRRVLLELVLEAWIRMVYVDGVFQSDPHPGNLLARLAGTQPELCIVDFGQVKILPRKFHKALTKSVMHFVTRNTDGFIEALVEIGLVPKGREEDARAISTKAIERYGSMTPEQVQGLSFEWVRDEMLGELAHFRGIVVPQELVLYGRTLGLLHGLTKQIDPTVDAFALARPHVLSAILSAPSDDEESTG